MRISAGIGDEGEEGLPDPHGINLDRHIGKVELHFEAFVFQVLLQYGGQFRRLRQAQGIAVAKSEGRYAGRQADEKKNELIIELRTGGKSIARTAKLASCSTSQVKRIWALHLASA